MLAQEITIMTNKYLYLDKGSSYETKHYRIRVANMVTKGS
jgi:hypothetical protein